MDDLDARLGAIEARLSILEMPRSKSTPPGSKRIALYSAIGSALVIATGAVLSAYITSRATAAARSQASEVSRQTLADSEDRERRLIERALESHEAKLRATAKAVAKANPPPLNKSPDVVTN